jgi:hypothetical protein
VDYLVGEGSERHLKRVRYFLCMVDEPIGLGPLPSQTHERRWAKRDEVAQIALVNEALRPVLAAAFDGGRYPSSGPSARIATSEPVG